MEPQISEDAEIEDAFVEGVIRLDNCADNGTCAIVTASSIEGREALILRRQRARMNRKELDFFYMELLKGAKDLVDFWEANAGGTADFPICVTGDSEKVFELLGEKFGRVGSTLRVLMCDKH